MSRDPGNVEATHLHLTEKGMEWLSQLDLEDRQLGRELLSSLCLISHTAFERGLDRLLRETADGIEGPVALFATRELDDKGEASLFEQAASSDGSADSLDAVGRGADLGSEARVAAIIRGLARSDRGKYLKHPSVDAMRSAKCRALFIVDDLIGSGQRTIKFIDAIWRNRTIRAWWSRGYIRIVVVAFASTEMGRTRVAHHKSRPEIGVEMECPTFDTLPWPRSKRDIIAAFCAKYGAKTSKKKYSMGYGGVKAALVFEHGCPNNAPAVLWAPSTRKYPWTPLFPGRSVLPEHHSAFPAEVTRRDPVTILVEAGQRRLADARTESPPHPLGDNVLIILALAGRRIISRGALSYATGLAERDCAELVERCIAWGLLTPNLRFTTAGRAELSAFRERAGTAHSLPKRGDEYYYPKSLRGHIDG